MKRFISIFLITLLFISCKKNVTGQENDNLIMPLAIGNSWTFEIHQIQDDSKEIFTFTIIGDYEKDGMIWYW